MLAGYLKILGPQVVQRFPTVNTHPALLPAFPGAHAVRDALAHGVKITGVTVHWANPVVDAGEIIAQAAVPVLDGDDEARLRGRVQAAERPLYVATIGRLVRQLGVSV